MKIGIDLDDVLVNFIDAYIAISNRLHKKPPLGTKPIDWAWSNLNISSTEMAENWAEVARTDGFWENLPLQEGATPELIQQLDHDHDLFFITARVQSKGDSVRHQSARMLENKLGVKHPTVIVSMDKGPLAAAIGLDYFVDDRPKNVIEILQHVPHCKAFLKNSSHNIAFDARGANIPRVADFDSFAVGVMTDDIGRSSRGRGTAV